MRWKSARGFPPPACRLSKTQGAPWRRPKLERCQLAAAFAPSFPSPLRPKAAINTANAHQRRTEKESEGQNPLEFGREQREATRARLVFFPFVSLKREKERRAETESILSRVASTPKKTPNFLTHPFKGRDNELMGDIRGDVELDLFKWWREEGRD